MKPSKRDRKPCFVEISSLPPILLINETVRGPSKTSAGHSICRRCDSKRINLNSPQLISAFGYEKSRRHTTVDSGADLELFAKQIAEIASKEVKAGLRRVTGV